MNIKCFGGVNEIGGNKILVEHEDTRIFLDFGKSFNQYSKYFSEFLNPRKSTALKDFFELNLIPDIKGIYRQDYLKHMGRPPEEKSVDAVLLSHAHADHAQYIHFLRKDIPIYCSEPTYTILKAIEETGTAPFSELATTCDAFTFYRNKKGGLSKVTRRKKDHLQEREFHIMKPEKTVEIGSLEAEMMPVDHSLPGASSFLIYSNEGNLVYTGDIRFHGYNEKESKRFVKKSERIETKWLICEGTRIDEKEKDSEQGVKQEIKDLISEAERLVFVEHPIRDLDRVTTIFEAAKENDREFVVNLKLAYMIKSLGKNSLINLEDVKILIPQKRWGLICSDRKDQEEILEEFHPKREYSSWEKEIIWRGKKERRENSITYEDLRENPSRYVVSMSLWEINQLIDIQPKNAIWIKSICEPFSDEMLIDEERKNNWLNHFDIKKFSAHASGHASGEEIKSMINRINPEFLIPVHTEHPELFNKHRKVKKR